MADEVSGRLISSKRSVKARSRCLMAMQSVRCMINFLGVIVLA